MSAQLHGWAVPEYRARSKSGRRSPLRKVNFCAYSGPKPGEWPAIPRNKIAAQDPGRSKSGVTERRHRVDQLQTAGLLSGSVKRSAARAYDGAMRHVGAIGHSPPYNVRQIELAVAVCMRTWKLEESWCRWIQLMRLLCRRVGACAFEPELEPKLLNARECRT